MALKRDILIIAGDKTRLNFRLRAPESIAGWDTRYTIWKSLDDPAPVYVGTPAITDVTTGRWTLVLTKDETLALLAAADPNVIGTRQPAFLHYHDRVDVGSEALLTYGDVTLMRKGTAA